MRVAYLVEELRWMRHSSAEKLELEKSVRDYLKRSGDAITEAID